MSCQRVNIFSKGTLKEIKSEGPANDLIVIVNFPENHDWKGLYSEIELAPSCGLEVRNILLN